MSQKYKELSESKQSQIVSAWRCGFSISTIVKQLNFAKTTVQDVINLYEETRELKPLAW
ncbi:28232_t:CDS:1, partial [Racocetra persica]